MTARFSIPLGRGNRFEAADAGGLAALFCLRLDRSARHCLVRIGAGARVKRTSRFHLRGFGARVEIGAGARISAQITLGPGRRPGGTSGAILVIGDGVRAHGIRIVGRLAPISIGAGSILSHEIEIRASDAHKLFEIGGEARINPDTPVEIGPECWIGARAMILQGTSLPRGTVVGAQALVKHAIGEENAVVAGNPARIIRRGVRWER